MGSEIAFGGGEITVLLKKLSGGDLAAISRVMAALYSDLNRIAELRLNGERPDHTLEPAALVSEVYLNFLKNRKIRWNSRGHFLAAAAEEMRRVLVDYARARNSLKRGGGVVKLQATEGAVAALVENSPQEFLEINELLDQLAAEDPRLAKVTQLRCFGGLTHREISEVLGVNERTIKRDWSIAKAWLGLHLEKKKNHGKRGLAAGKGSV